MVRNIGLFDVKDYWCWLRSLVRRFLDAVEGWVFTVYLLSNSHPSWFLSLYFYAFICFFFCAISLPVSVLCGGIIWNFLGDPFWWYQLNSVLNFLFCHGHYSFSSLFRQVLSSHLISIWLMFQTGIRAFAAYCNNPRSSSGDDPTQANSHYYTPYRADQMI